MTKRSIIARFDLLAHRAREQPCVAALGANIGCKLRFKKRNLVFQQQFAFFHTPQLQLIVGRRCQKSGDGEIKVAMFFFEFDKARLDGGHVGGNISRHDVGFSWPFDYTASHTPVKGGW
jgi:hypothetical protein